MILIECFTEHHMDNFATCLWLRPEKVLLFGDVSQMSQPVKWYRELLKQKRLKTRIVLRDVRQKDFGDICDALEECMAEENDYVIDITGGDELVIMAIGAVLAGLDEEKRRRVYVERFDYKTNKVIDCVNDNRDCGNPGGKISVAQMITLYGGRLYQDSYQPPVTCKRQMLDGLWKIVKEEPKAWNRMVALLNEFESRGNIGMHISLPLKQIRGGIRNFGEKLQDIRLLLQKLKENGVIDDNSSEDTLDYTYRSPLLHYCLRKSGNVLEVKTLLEARAVLEKGRHYFDDCRMSVRIDWDGIVYPPEKNKAETRNEIDVVLMRGMTPLFISCKNGNVGEDELYKLHTVATRFGGPLTRKMMIVTDLERKSPASERSFAQRAWDMDIFLVTDAVDLSPAEWRDIFKQAMQ